MTCKEHIINPYKLRCEWCGKTLVEIDHDKDDYIFYGEVLDNVLQT